MPPQRSQMMSSVVRNSEYHVRSTWARNPLRLDLPVVTLVWEINSTGLKVPNFLIVPNDLQIIILEWARYQIAESFWLN